MIEFLYPWLFLLLLLPLIVFWFITSLQRKKKHAVQVPFFFNIGQSQWRKTTKWSLYH